MEKEESAAWRLFHIRYRVFVPSVLLVSSAYAQKYGVYVTGDPAIDASSTAVNDLVVKTGAEMAELNAKGAGINARRLGNPRDALPIYRDIVKHLKEWDLHIRTTRPHIDDIPPITEFAAMDDLAREFHESAMLLNLDTEQVNVGRSQLMAMNYRRNPGGTRQMLVKEAIAEDGQVKPYRSILTDIERSIAQGLVWR